MKKLYCIILFLLFRESLVKNILGINKFKSMKEIFLSNSL